MIIDLDTLALFC